MTAGTGGPHDRDNYELGVRIAISWSEIRRGAGMGAVRDYLFGTGDDRLDQGQMDSLDLLAQQPSWRMSELADALRVDPSTATRAVQRLVNVGLATRRPSDDDGRVVMVEITAAGRERHADVAHRRMVLMGHMLKAFRPSERPVLADMLERFIAAVDDFVAADSGAEIAGIGSADTAGNDIAVDGLVAADAVAGIAVADIAVADIAVADITVADIAVAG